MKRKHLIVVLFAIPMLWPAAAEGADVRASDPSNLAPQMRVDRRTIWKFRNEGSSAITFAEGEDALTLTYSNGTTATFHVAPNDDFGGDPYYQSVILPTIAGPCLISVDDGTDTTHWVGNVAERMPFEAALGCEKRTYTLLDIREDSDDVANSFSNGSGVTQRVMVMGMEDDGDANTSDIGRKQYGLWATGWIYRIDMQFGTDIAGDPVDDELKGVRFSTIYYDDANTSWFVRDQTELIGDTTHTTPADRGPIGLEASGADGGTNGVNDWNTDDVNRFDFWRPLECKAGDYIGWEYVVSGDVTSLYDGDTGIGVFMRFQNNATPANGAAFGAVSTQTLALHPYMDVYIQSPDLLVTGASLGAGHTSSSAGNWTWNESGVIQDVDETADIAALLLKRLKHLGMDTAINYSRGGTNSSAIRTNQVAWITDWEPALVVNISGGGLNLMVTQTASLSSYDTFESDYFGPSGVASSVNAVSGARYVMTNITPTENSTASYTWPDGDNNTLLSQEIDAWNDRLAVAAERAGTTLVNIHDLVGYERSSAPPDNRWDVVTLFDGGDALHLSAAGYQAVADRIYEELVGGDRSVVESTLYLERGFLSDSRTDFRR